VVAPEGLPDRHRLVNAEMFEHGQHVGGHLAEPEAGTRSRRVGAAVATQVDGDGTERIAHRERERLEEARAHAVRVQQQERRPVATPVERGDAQPVALDRHDACITYAMRSPRTHRPVCQTGSAARMPPSFSSCGVAPPSVSSSSFAHRK
jgi:hypothetical protein